MEDAFDKFQFPSYEIDISVIDYAKIICTLLDIPIHKLTNNKSIIEALHVLFTLYNEFKNNPHFQHNQFQGTDKNEDVNVLKIE